MERAKETRVRTVDSKLDDGELVRRACGGDRDAFTALVTRYRGMVYATAFCCLGSAEDAQDAAQEAFVVAHCRLGQLREPDRFAPWLRRLTLNGCADALRRRGARRLSLDGDAADRHALLRRGLLARRGRPVPGNPNHHGPLPSPERQTSAAGRDAGHDAGRDERGQATCLAGPGLGRLGGDMARARAALAQALPLDEAGDVGGATYCRAVLALRLCAPFPGPWSSRSR